MEKLLFVKYGEIYLKGLNRPFFMRTLVQRVRQALEGYDASVTLHDARILVRDIEHRQEALSRIVKVFGVHSVCLAYETDKNDYTGILSLASEIMKPLKGTFKVDSRRSDKHYFLDSPQLNAKIGEYILEQNGERLKVDVHRPEYVLNVEIRDKAYLYQKIIPAVGGIPVGTGGKAALLLSGGIDSPVAGYMIAKRGVELIAIHFYSFPYTSEQAKQKVLDLAAILSQYACGIKVYVVPFTTIQTTIHEKCPEEYTTLIMRRYMMRIANLIAKKEHCGAIVTGESLGQVASQTMEALNATNAVAQMPVFRPLIGFDKIDIIRKAEEIGTLETSNLPYEDCCTVFTPRHPATRPRLEKVEQGERYMEGEDLITRAVAESELVCFNAEGRRVTA